MLIDKCDEDDRMFAALVVEFLDSTGGEVPEFMREIRRESQYSKGFWGHNSAD